MFGEDHVVFKGNGGGGGQSSFTQCNCHWRLILILAQFLMRNETTRYG